MASAIKRWADGVTTRSGSPVPSKPPKPSVLAYQAQAKEAEKATFAAQRASDKARLSKEAADIATAKAAHEAAAKAHDAAKALVPMRAPEHFQHASASEEHSYQASKQGTWHGGKPGSLLGPDDARKPRDER